MTFPPIIAVDGPLVEPYEYFCYGCGECILSIVGRDDCANCGSRAIVKAEVGELNLGAHQFRYAEARRRKEAA